MIKSHSLEKLFENKYKINKLLIQKKEQLGIKPEKILFVGDKNLTRFRWCGMEALLRLKQFELATFKNYLYDRINYAKKLNKIDNIPINEHNILDIGEDISFEDIKPFMAMKKMAENYSPPWVEYNNQKIYFASKNISKNQYQKIKQEKAKYKNVLILEEETIYDFIKKLPVNNQTRNIVQLFFQNKSPTIRWNFKIGKYICIAQPNQIENDLVYAYCPVMQKDIISFRKYPIIDLADLHGYLFQKTKKRLEFFVLKTSKNIVIESDIDKESILNIIEDIQNIEISNHPLSPQAWKCKPCRYKEDCHIYSGDNKAIFSKKERVSEKGVRIDQHSKRISKKRSFSSPVSKSGQKKIIKRSEVDLDELVNRYKIKRFGKK